MKKYRWLIAAAALLIPTALIASNYWNISYVQMTNSIITNSSLNSSPIGVLSPSSANFTTLQVGSATKGGTGTLIPTLIAPSSAGQAICSNDTAGTLVPCAGTTQQSEGIIITSGICTTVSANPLLCPSPMSATWATPFADANYVLTCTTNVPTGTGGAPSIIVYVVSKTSSGFSLQLQAGQSSSAGNNTVSEIDCTGIHN